MSETGGDLPEQREVSGVSHKGRTRKKKGDEEGSSSADDYGLRRRFIGSHRATDRPKEVDPEKRSGLSTLGESAEEPDDSAEDERGRKPQFGAQSRRILGPEEASRNLPLMMKKKKKKKSTAPKHSLDRPGVEPKTKRKKKPLTKWHAPGDFLTGDDVRDPRQDSYVIYVMRDFIIYLIFMIITSLIIFGAGGPADNYYANVLGDLVTKSKFKSPIEPAHEMTFYDINHRRDMWAFIDQVVLRLLYERAKYSADPGNIDAGYQVMLENMLFGVPQLRQVRVKGKTCDPAPLFDGIFNDCADYYSKQTEDTTTFGSRNTTAWIYQPGTREHVPVNGIFSTYGEGGFSVNLGRSLNVSRKWIRELQHDGWIRFGSRAVVLDFNLFNVNTQLFCSAKLVFEMPPMGGIVSQAYFTTVKLVRYSGGWGYFIMSCQIAFIGFILYYTYEEISQMVRLKEVYLINWWNMLDVTIVLWAYVTIGLGVAAMIWSRGFLIQNLNLLPTNHHVSFDRMVVLQTRHHVAQAILAFFVWVKILKFSTLNRTVSLVLRAFAKVRSELIAATVMMFLLLMGFAILGMSIAGSLFQQLSSLGPALFTLVGLLGGGIHFYFTHKVSEATFRAWLLLYIIANIVIYINIYVALVVHGFELAQMETDHLSNTAMFSDVLREVFCRFLLLIRKPHIVQNIRFREIEKQNIRIFIHLAAILSRHGFNNREIALIFNKHAVHFGKNISIETMSDIYEGINVRNQLFIETEGHNQITEQLEKISRNLEQVDQTIMSVMTKVDTLTNKYLKDNVKK